MNEAVSIHGTLQHLNSKYVSRPSQSVSTETLPLQGVKATPRKQATAEQCLLKGQATESAEAKAEEYATTGGKDNGSEGQGQWQENKLGKL